MLFTNYVTSAWRNILRHKLFSIINILGLAIGLAAVMLITIFVRNEISYDKFWKNADQIYRVHMTFEIPGQDPQYRVSSTAPTVEAMARNYPEITHYTRFNSRGRTVTLEEDSYQEEVTIADKAVIDIFDFDVIAGDIKTSLDNNTDLILNETLVKKYFGSENPIGKILTINMGDFVRDYQVKAVIKDLPKNSKIGFEILVLAVPEEWRFYDAWFATTVQAYFLVTPDANMANIEDTLVSFVDRNFPPPTLWRRKSKS